MFTFIRLNFPAKPLLTYLKKSYNLQLLDLLLLLVFQKQNKAMASFSLLVWSARRQLSFRCKNRNKNYKITTLLINKFYKCLQNKTYKRGHKTENRSGPSGPIFIEFALQLKNLRFLILCTQRNFPK